MPKFLKGVYVISLSEFEELLDKFNRKEFMDIKGKQYLPLYIKRKSEYIIQKDLEGLIMTETCKKNIYEALDSTYFKLEKFCRETYKTTEISEIREIIKAREL